jgi:hypothetical protein
MAHLSAEAFIVLFNLAAIKKKEFIKLIFLTLFYFLLKPVIQKYKTCDLVFNYFNSFCKSGLLNLFTLKFQTLLIQKLVLLIGKMS